MFFDTSFFFSPPLVQRPKPPPTVYLLYSNAKRKELKASNPSMSPKDAMAACGAGWKLLDASNNLGPIKLKYAPEVKRLTDIYTEAMKSYSVYGHTQEAPPLASEFSLRAEGLACAAAVESCQSFVVETDNKCGQLPKIHALLKSLEVAIPNAVLGDMADRPNISNSCNPTFGVQDIASLLFSVRVLHRFPRYIVNMSTSAEKLEAEGTLSYSITPTGLDKPETDTIKQVGDPHITDKHLLDLVAGAGVKAATVEALQEL